MFVWSDCLPTPLHFHKLHFNAECFRTKATSCEQFVTLFEAGQREVIYKKAWFNYWCPFRFLFPYLVFFLFSFFLPLCIRLSVPIVPPWVVWISGDIKNCSRHHMPFRLRYRIRKPVTSVKFGVGVASTPVPFSGLAGRGWRVCVLLRRGAIRDAHNSYRWIVW
jgi:hypothetical protein